MKKFFIYPIKIYRLFISPILPASCRFYPTCSEYALESFERFGIFKAIYLTIKRVIKCHPFHKGGFDPVPLRRSR